jgi:hypothetical protein
MLSIAHYNFSPSNGMQAEAQREAARKQKEQVGKARRAPSSFLKHQQERIDAEKAAVLYRARM